MTDECKLGDRDGDRGAAPPWLRPLCRRTLSAVTLLVVSGFCAASASAGGGVYQGALRPVLPTPSETRHFEKRATIKAVGQPESPAARPGFAAGWEENLEGQKAGLLGTATAYRYISIAAAHRAVRALCAQKGMHCLAQRIGLTDEASRAVLRERTIYGPVICHSVLARRINVLYASLACAHEPAGARARNASVDLATLMAFKLVRRLTS